MALATDDAENSVFMSTREKKLVEFPSHQLFVRASPRLNLILSINHMDCSGVAEGLSVELMGICRKFSPYIQNLWRLTGSVGAGVCAFLRSDFIIYCVWGKIGFNKYFFNLESRESITVSDQIRPKWCKLLHILSHQSGLSAKKRSEAKFNWFQSQLQMSEVFLAFYLRFPLTFPSLQCCRVSSLTIFQQQQHSCVCVIKLMMSERCVRVEIWQFRKFSSHFSSVCLKLSSMHEDTRAADIVLIWKFLHSKRSTEALDVKLN